MGDSQEILSMEHYSREEECLLCQLILPDSRRLFRHLFDDHHLSKEKINEIKGDRRLKQVQKKMGGKDRPILSCSICHRPYLSKLGLARHREKEHDEERPTPAAFENIICPIIECGSRFQTYFDLATHADDEHRDMAQHNETFRIHRIVFDSFDRFLLWRQEQEDTTLSRFYTRSTETKIRYAKKVWLLKCIHTNRKRQNLYVADHCTAFIRVCEKFNGQVEVVACFGHLGHRVQGVVNQQIVDDDQDRVVRKRMKMTIQNDDGTYGLSDEYSYVEDATNPIDEMQLLDSSQLPEVVVDEIC